MPRGVKATPETRAYARELREQGWKYREIGEYLGVPLKTVSSWVNDPELSALRPRKLARAGKCEDCGAPTAYDGHNGNSGASPRCTGCARMQSHDRQRREWAARQETAEGLWRLGYSLREICEELGIAYRKNRAAVWRRKGYLLPYRRPAMIEVGQRFKKA